MTKSKNDELKKTKALMGALVRMKPKPHEEMKVRKNQKTKKVNASPKLKVKS
jgi:hypothetical protein